MLEIMSWWQGSLAAVASLRLVLPAPAPAAAAADDIRITHEPALCMLVNVHSRLRACLRPVDGMRPRAYFRAEGDASWYYVEMRKEGECFVALLPKPLAGTRRLEYYVFAQSARPPFAQAQTPVYLAEVRSGEQGCGTPFATSAKVHAIPAAGDMRAPGGFAADGLQGLPKPERKMGAAGLVIGAGAAAASAAVAGVVLVKSQGADATPAPSTTIAPTEPPTPTPPPAARTATPTPAPDAPTDPGAPTVPGPTLPPTTLPPTTLPGTLLPTTLLPPTLLPTTLLPRVTLPISLLDGGQAEEAHESSSESRALSCRSIIAAAGGRGQVVLNSAAAWFPSDDASVWRHTARRGTNRLELLLVQGAPGTWRLELLPATRLRAGSLRATVGAVLRIEDRAIVLRLAGRPGERAVVVFELE
jgi:hypothetical protein